MHLAMEDLELVEGLIAERIRQREEQKPENFIKKYRFNPYLFVLDEWPWDVKGGPLEGITGPDEYQKQFLIDLGKHAAERNFDGHTPVEPIKMTISSCVGSGKSTLGAFVSWWIIRTRPYSIGTVTSGNYDQLEKGTWADIKHWARMSRGADLFDIQASVICHKDPKFREKWKMSPKTAKEENSQSFAGQHARTSTSWGLFDEASEIPAGNWQAFYGCLTDGEPMMFAWGQMVQNSGEFYNVAFGEKSKNWDARIFDGRYSAFTNKETIKEWAEEWGEDSDFYRVRVLGLPPRASSLQFISQNLVDEARKRDHRPLPDEPLVVGFDAANGGSAKFVIAFRRGLDAKSIPPIMMPGDTPRDVVVAKLAEVMSDRRPGRQVTALFGDQAFGAVILERLRNSGFTNVFEVNFGESSVEKLFLNMRAQMWGSMKEWLQLGAIPDDEKIAQQFMGPGFHHRNGKLALESKESMAKRGTKSPDMADALACTFFRKVANFRKEMSKPVAAPKYYGQMGGLR